MCGCVTENRVPCERSGDEWCACGVENIVLILYEDVVCVYLYRGFAGKVM